MKFLTTLLAFLFFGTVYGQTFNPSVYQPLGTRTQHYKAPGALTVDSLFRPPIFRVPKPGLGMRGSMYYSISDSSYYKWTGYNWLKMFDGPGGGSTDTSSQYIRPNFGVNIYPNADTIDLNATIGSLPIMDSLRVTIPPDGSVVQTLGYFATGDGGAGLYKYDSLSTAVDDSVTAIAPFGQSVGRFIFVPQGGTIYGPQFGVKADGTTNNYWRLQKMADYVSSGANGTPHMVLQRGPIGHYPKVVFGTNSAGDPTQTSLLIEGQGQNSGGNVANAGGTMLLWLGPVGGAGSMQLELQRTAYRFFRLANITLSCAKLDAVESNFSFFQTNSSRAYFENVGFAYGTYGVKVNENGGANAEFMNFERCSYNNSLSFFWSNAFQALSTKFYSCNGTVAYGGIAYNWPKASGGTLVSCDGSYNAGGDWAASTAFTDQRIYYKSKGAIYGLLTPGTTSTTPLTGTGSSITNGTAVFYYVRPITGTRYIYAGGSQPDVISVIGGRIEGISTPVEFENGAENMAVRFDGTTITLNGSDTINYPFFKFNGNATGSISFSNGAIYDADGLTNNRKIPVNTGTSEGATVSFRNSLLAGVIVTAQTNLESRNKIASATNQSINTNKIWIENCIDFRTSGTALKRTFIDKVLVDNTDKNQVPRKFENLLLQSGYGLTSGNNTAAAAPWGHYGVQSFLFNNFMKSGTESQYSSSGKNLRFNVSSGVYQDIPAWDLTAASTTSTGYSIVGYYKALVSLWGNTGVFRFALVNSVDTTKIYDEVIFNTNGNQDYKMQLVELQARVRKTDVGYIRLIQQNLSASATVNLNMYWQMAYQSSNAAFFPTTTEAVQGTITYDQVSTSQKITDVLVVPLKNNDYGASLAWNVNHRGTLYRDTTTGRMIYGGIDRWESMPRQDSGTAAPVSGYWPQNFVRWSSNPGAGTLMWVCTAAGTPGTWVAISTAGGGGGSGTVTSVGAATGTSGTDFNITGSPVTGSGVITFNIPTAASSVRGLLSGTDWTTFNNKLSSIDTTNITSFHLKVKSLLSGTAPITYNSTTGAVGITQSTTSTNGYLSSTDWNTFNNKQSPFTFAWQTLTDGATVTAAGGNVLNSRVTIAGNRTLAFTSPTEGMTYNVTVIQDGTGGRTLTLPNGLTAALNSAAGDSTSLTLVKKQGTGWDIFSSARNSGTYSPTATVVSNITGSVGPVYMIYSRVGDVVTGSFYTTANATSTATDISFRLTLPFASNLTGTDAWGTVASAGNSGMSTANVGHISAYAAGDLLQVQMAVTNTGGSSVYGTFTYLIH